MPGILRYAEYLFLDPRLGSSENAQKQHTFISDRHSFPWIAAKIDGNITASFQGILAYGHNPILNHIEQ